MERPSLKRKSIHQLLAETHGQLDTCLKRNKQLSRRVLMLEKELALLNEQCEQRQNVIDAYQKHYAKTNQV